MQAGEFVDKRFELKELVGESGMGLVYAATDHQTQKPVAIKFIFPHVALDETAVGAFLRQSQAVGQLSSPHLLPVLATGITTDGAPYVVRPFLEGKDLGQLLADEERLAPGHAVRLIRQACAGLAAAHEAKLCHWNIKPQNLFISTNALGEEQVYLLDFSMSILRDSLDDATADATVSGTTVGMPYYLPLELFKGTGKRDHRADIYSLGALLYEMLSGTTPYESESYTRLLLLIATRDPMSLKERLPQVTDQLATVVSQAMMREPHDRFDSTLEMGTALAPCEGDPDYRDKLTNEAAKRKDNRPPSLIRTRPDIPVDKLREMELGPPNLSGSASTSADTGTGTSTNTTRRRPAPAQRWINYLTAFFFAVAALLAVAAVSRSCQNAAAPQAAPAAPTSRAPLAADQELTLAGLNPPSVAQPPGQRSLSWLSNGRECPHAVLTVSPRLTK
jgi:serine/threonine-protein kinase